MSSFETKTASNISDSNKVQTSAQQSITNPSSTTNNTQQSSSISNIRLPSDLTNQHAAKLAIVEDKPIMLDYWVSSLEKKALIGVRENGEKLLVKSAEEYTSPIAKFYKSATEYIIITENSIYIVSSDIQTRKIT
jgi:hypothetical protein